MKSYILSLFLVFSSYLWSQKEYSLTFLNEDYKIIKKNIPSKFKDSLQLNSYIKELQNSAIKKGYLLASFDTLKYKKQAVDAYFNIGHKFGKANLHFSKDDLKLLSKTLLLNEKILTNLEFSPLEISSLLKRIQKSLESNGYPFVKIQLINAVIDENQLSADVKIDLNNYYEWTKIHLKGDSSISEVFITNLIGIKPNSPFSQVDFANISKRIKQINFLNEIKPAEILFTKSGVELFLYLKSNPISSVNGVIGFQPNTVTNKVNLTGDISLKLVNVLKRGELFDLNWKSIQDQTQSLHTKLNYPFIFKTNFGLDGQFNLYKLDSSFLELKSSLGVQYFMKGGNYIKVFFQNISSNVLTQNTSTASMSNVQTNNYGLAIYRKQMDYIPNPSKGFAINSSIAIGTRKSVINDSATTISSTTYRGEFSLEWLYPILKRHILYVSNNSMVYYAPTIFQNELERFGGQTTQRGFNEQELFSSTKSTISLEYRYLLDKNSRAFLFFDQTWYENNAIQYYQDTPFGFGAGFSFGTNIGIFSLSYALGKQFSNPILIRDGKIHFGYVSYF